MPISDVWSLMIENETEEKKNKVTKTYGKKRI
jgi:hypothetical protein